MAVSIPSIALTLTRRSLIQPKLIDEIDGIIQHIRIAVHRLRIADVHAAHVGIGREPAALRAGHLAEERVFGVRFRVVIVAGELD